MKRQQLDTLSRFMEQRVALPPDVADAVTLWWLRQDKARSRRERYGLDLYKPRVDGGKWWGHPTRVVRAKQAA